MWMDKLVHIILVQNKSTNIKYKKYMMWNLETTVMSAKIL